MSLLNYFRPTNEKHLNDEILPSPSCSLSTVMPSTAIAAANSSIKKEMKPEQSARSSYLILTPVQRYQVGKRAAEHDVTSTIRYYAQKFRIWPRRKRVFAG